MLKREENLVGVSEQLVLVVKKAATLVGFDVIVTEGVRSKERQRELYALGRTKPGKIVTWTLQSKHIAGKAVDLVPSIQGKVDWNDVISFTLLGKAMKDAAKALNIQIRWGWDWDNDGVLREKGETDGPHFELVT